AEGKIYGFLGFPPDPQELRARKIGRVLLNSAVDRPWSQYFCCLVSANREFVRRHPVATKRALRAILKGDQLCAVEPGRGARAFADRGFKGAPEKEHTSELQSRFDLVCRLLLEKKKREEHRLRTPPPRQNHPHLPSRH